MCVIQSAMLALEWGVYLRFAIRAAGKTVHETTSSFADFQSAEEKGLGFT